MNIVNSPQETTENLKKDSPYSKYYDELLLKNAVNIQTETTSSNEKKNEYFNPDLFNIIRGYLHILPLWIGCLIYRKLIKYDGIKIKSRLDNNCVENNFGHIKNNLFHKNLQTPSAMSAMLYDKYKLKYLLNYMKPDEENELGNFFNILYCLMLIFFALIEIKLVDANEDGEKEVFSVKSKKSNQISKKFEKWAKQRYAGIKRQKKIYFEAKKDFIYLEDKYEELNENLIYSEDFEAPFSLESLCFY